MDIVSQTARDLAAELPPDPVVYMGGFVTVSVSDERLDPVGIWASEELAEKALGLMAAEEGMSPVPVFELKKDEVTNEDVPQVWKSQNYETPYRGFFVIMECKVLGEARPWGDEDG